MTEFTKFSIEERVDYYLGPANKNIYHNDELIDYNSTINPLTKEQLKDYLEMLKLL